MTPATARTVPSLLSNPWESSWLKAVERRGKFQAAGLHLPS